MAGDCWPDAVACTRAQCSAIMPFVPVAAAEATGYRQEQPVVALRAPKRRSDARLVVWMRTSELSSTVTHAR
jgi:hypothetical protein